MPLHPYTSCCAMSTVFDVVEAHREDEHKGLGWGVVGFMLSISYQVCDLPTACIIGCVCIFVVQVL